MRETESVEFGDLMETLALWYRQPRPAANEILAYFGQLKGFALSIVEEAIQRYPLVHPDWFPKVGELLAICGQVVGELRSQQDSADSHASIYKMANCQHDWRDELEPEGSLIVSFKVCSHCTKAIPTFSSDARFARQRGYFVTAGVAEQSSF